MVLGHTCDRCGQKIYPWEKAVRVLKQRFHAKCYAHRGPVEHLQRVPTPQGRRRLPS